MLLFTDGDTAYGSGEHLFTWRVSGAPPAGRHRHRPRLRRHRGRRRGALPGPGRAVPAEEPFPAFLEIDAEGGPITAYLDDADTITNLEAGAPCGE